MNPTMIHLSAQSFESMFNSDVESPKTMVTIAQNATAFRLVSNSGTAPIMDGNGQEHL
jgi:hypothetical protein